MFNLPTFSTIDNKTWNYKYHRYFDKIFEYFPNINKQKYNERSEKTNWGSDVLDPRNHIATIPDVIIDELNNSWKMFIDIGLEVIKQRNMKVCE